MLTERASDPLDLELQVVVSDLTWAMARLGYTGRFLFEKKNKNKTRTKTKTKTKTSHIPHGNKLLFGPRISGSWLRMILLKHMD